MEGDDRERRGRVYSRNVYEWPITWTTEWGLTLGVGGAGESRGGKMRTTIIEQQ